MVGGDVTGGIKVGTKGWAVGEEVLAGGEGVLAGGLRGGRSMVGGHVSGGVKEGTKVWATGLSVGVDFGVETGDWMENVKDVDGADDTFNIGD